MYLSEWLYHTIIIIERTFIKMVLGFLIITKHRLNGKGRVGGYHGAAYPPTGVFSSHDHVLKLIAAEHSYSL